jgi:hypothetical protein
MDKTQIEKLSMGLVKLIDTGERRYTDWLHANDKKLVKGLMKIYGAMPITASGNVSKSELRRFLATRRGLVTKMLNELGYTQNIADYVANFERISEQNILLQKEVNGLDTDKLQKLISPVQRLLVNSTYDNLLYSGLDNIFFAPIEKILLQIGTVGVSLQEAVVALNDAIVGTGEYSKFTNYALTAGRDALGQYDGTINQKIAATFGLNAVVYVGTIVENSRPQCERWLAYEFIPMSELTNEIEWAFNNGKGMIDQTTAATFVMYRGGYSCRHKALPIRVTDEQIENWRAE